MKPTIIDCETTGLNPFKDKLLFYHTIESNGAQFLDSHLDKKFDGIGHNLKFDALFLKVHKNIDVNTVWDTRIAEYILHIDQSHHLKDCVKRYFGEKGETLIDICNEITGQKRKSLPKDFYEIIPRERFIEYGKKDPLFTRMLMEKQIAEFKERPELYRWYKDVEIPLCNILTQSELKGVRINKEELISINERLKADLLWLDTRIEKFIGRKINLNSPKQLQELLFKDLKLKSVKKTKTKQPSTDHKSLEQLAKTHAVAKLLLEYKEKSKIVSTYTDSIIDQLDSNNRLHGNFNQCGTKTRRFSSDSPNLQNIPTRSEIGKEIRRTFIPDKGYKYWDFDLDQIELRLLAHFSKDPILIKWFKEEKDIHQGTADIISKTLGRPLDRSMGKLLNFSLIYGKTAYGFAKDWNCSQDEAQEIIDAYFRQFPSVKMWMENQMRETRKNRGWTKTICGLPLFIDGLFASKSWEREHSERMCINYPIQGSSQDVLKLAVVRLYEEYKVYPILYVHDQIVYEVPEKSILQNEWFCDIINSVVKLEVPLKVTFKETNCWTKD